jgi:acyl-CoA thioesterase-1
VSLHAFLRRAIPIALVAAAALWYFGVGRSHVGRPTAGETVIAFGDSLVEGVGASPGHDLASVLGDRLGVSIINAGHRGDTASAALDRLDRDVFSRDPRIVIVLVGGNDFMRRVPRDTTFNALGEIVQRVRARGAAVVLVGVSLGLITDQYSGEYEALAGRTGSAYVPDVLGGILGHGDLMSDQVHPNDRGYAMVADRIEPALRDLLKK